MFYFSLKINLHFILTVLNVKDVQLKKATTVILETRPVEFTKSLKREFFLIFLLY